MENNNTDDIENFISDLQCSTTEHKKRGRKQVHLVVTISTLSDYNIIPHNKDSIVPQKIKKAFI